MPAAQRRRSAEDEQMEADRVQLCMMLHIRRWQMPDWQHFARQMDHTLITRTRHTLVNVGFTYHNSPNRLRCWMPCCMSYRQSHSVMCACTSPADSRGSKGLQPDSHAQVPDHWLAPILSDLLLAAVNQFPACGLQHPFQVGLQASRKEDFVPRQHSVCTLQPMLCSTGRSVRSMNPCAGACH